VTNQIQQLAQRTRDLMRTQGLDATAAIEFAIDQFAEAGLLLGPESEAASLASHQILGFGPLQPLLDDPDIEEIWLNQPGQAHYWRDGRVCQTRLELDLEGLKTIIQRMLRSSGRRLDRSQPFVDAMLPDGSRLHVVIPEVTREWSVNIRKFRMRQPTLSALIAAGSLNESTAAGLRDSLARGESLLITGATQAGKTTLLRALLNELPDTERVVSVEDTFELELAKPDWVAMQTVAAVADGARTVDMRELVKQSLRMRPSYLVIGEVRGAESLDLLIALNSGLPGMCTLHANSARAGVAKLMTLPLLAGENITREFLRAVVPVAFQMVVHLQRGADGQRRVAELMKVSDALAE